MSEKTDEDTAPLNEVLADLVREFADAVRGANIDGRQTKSLLNGYASWVEDNTTFPGLAASREALNLCRLGQGHWSEFCEDFGHEQYDPADG